MLPIITVPSVPFLIWEYYNTMQLADSTLENYRISYESMRNLQINEKSFGWKNLQICEFDV
jgi:hypothetical protein